MKPTQTLSYLESIPKEKQNFRLPSGRTIKEIVFHLVGWKNEVTEAYTKYFDEGIVPWFVTEKDPSKFNNELDERCRTKSYKEAIELLKDSYNKREIFIKRFGREKLVKNELEWMSEDAAEPHDIEHLKQIEQALYEKLVNDLADILKKNGEQVSEVEMTNNNFDDKGNLIRGKIPTITTEVGEIGVYDSTVYLTVIFPSTIFTEELFDTVKNYGDVHIYGLKKFQQDYYPANNFDFSNLEKSVKSEDNFQVQFNFRPSVQAVNIFKEYEDIDSKFQDLGIRPVNQLVAGLKE